MSNLKFRAKDAKINSDKKKAEIAIKTSEIKSHQKKIKRIFQKIIAAAIDGQKFFEFSDKNSDFLNFCFKEFGNLEFHVDFFGSTSDLASEEVRRNITDLQEKIQSIGEKANSDLGTIADRIYEFLSPHPEYVQVYEWLIDCYERKPLIRNDWYLWEYEKLGIVSGAEYDRLLESDVTQFQWQGKLKKFVSEIKRIHETAALEILNLKEKVYDLEAEEFATNDDFRSLSSDENIDLIEIFSLRVCWDEERIGDSPINHEISLFSPRTMCWLSSDNGQNLLNCIDSAIKSLSEQGKDELILRFFKESAQNYVFQYQKQEFLSPHPDIISDVYLSMGFNVEKISTKNLAQKDIEGSFRDIKLSW